MRSSFRGNGLGCSPSAPWGWAGSAASTLEIVDALLYWLVDQPSCDDARQGLLASWNMGVRRGALLRARARPRWHWHCRAVALGELCTWRCSCCLVEALLCARGSREGLGVSSTCSAASPVPGARVGSSSSWTWAPWGFWSPCWSCSCSWTWSSRAREGVVFLCTEPLRAVVQLGWLFRQFSCLDT